jgi:transposase
MRQRALDRTQPLLPIRPGPVERRTHDYDRHGTTSLFAALNVKTGTVIGRCHRRHRAVEFRKFLATIDEAVPAELDIHLILDNYATHKIPLIRQWLSKRPRFHLNFAPSGASWINLVERWFATLTAKQAEPARARSSAAALSVPRCCVPRR